MKDSQRQARVLVCQRGARRRYVVPRLMEEEGFLTALYTDSTAYSLAGGLATVLGKFGMKSPRLRALSSRHPVGVPAQKIFSSDRPLLSSLSRGWIPPDLSATYMKWGLHGANIVYSMYGEDFGFLQWAKEQGAKIIVDVFVHPSTNRIIAKETAGILGKGISDPLAAEAEDAHSKQVFELADLLLCPSSWVAEGVYAFAPGCAHKVRVVPYGSSLCVKDEINGLPKAGQVLFAGRNPLRKGLHYLADAVKIIRKAGYQIDVRAAGVDLEDIGWMPNAGEINCLGTLPMDRMQEEFFAAEVFVLPSLSEGQAGVVLEAMASGCPVIATRESGIDFDPRCGLTVPVRDAEALARALMEVLGKREKRNALAKGALRQAAMFSMEAWKKRLVHVVEEAHTL